MSVQGFRDSDGLESHDLTATTHLLCTCQSHVGILEISNYNDNILHFSFGPPFCSSM